MCKIMFLYNCIVCSIIFISNIYLYYCLYFFNILNILVKLKIFKFLDESKNM